MNYNFEIRKANINDAEVIYNITKEAFKKYIKDAGIPVKIDALEETLEDVIRDISSKEVFIALSDGIPVGSIRVEIKDDQTAFIYRFGVLPQNQKNGIGSSLISFIDNYLISKNIKRVCLYTAAKHKDLICFYYKMGFYVDHTTKDKGYIRAFLVKEYE
ncbi:MAG TPA: GNAT family N-acetyltransferase [Clostridiaceae bacterium]|nr:GNAT family N-acetyltransferase [Clostridiaceae bacterium]